MAIKNTQTDIKVDFIHIDCESNYFNTDEQVRIKNDTSFTDTAIASKLSGSNKVIGLFSRKRIEKDDIVLNSPSYPTSSIVYDQSGNARPILSHEIDYYASSSIDTYRNGVEIRQQSHWVAGLAKITAGTPGHLYQLDRYGDNEGFNLFSDNSFIDMSELDPADYIAPSEGMDTTTYPLAISSDVNPYEVMNGVLEPFPLRPVINKFSIDDPEFRGVSGDLSCGNLKRNRAAEQVLTVDYYTPDIPNRSAFLDGGSPLNILISGSNSHLGNAEGYVFDGYNVVPSFVDVSYPRGTPPALSTQLSLSGALKMMSPGGTTYVSWKQKAATSGYVHDDASLGTDSITYGGLSADKYYSLEEISRKRGRRSVMPLRDARSFIAESGPFDEKTILLFIPQDIQYPEMMPEDYMTSLETPKSESISKLYHSGSITVNRSYLPGMFDSILNDRLAKDDF